jgi:hypothetical protein
MKGKRLSSYAGALIITLFGAFATMLIVDATYATAESMEYAQLDPTSLDTDFGR